jgi:hypothetical protein
MLYSGESLLLNGRSGMSLMEVFCTQVILNVACRLMVAEQYACCPLAILYFQQQRADNDVLDK